MAELIFEIATEELPALALEPSEIFIKDFLIENFRKMSLAHSEIEVWGTPRRLVVLIENLANKQDDIEEEVLGPKSAIAFDASGALTEAGLGFMKAKGLTEADTYRKKTEKGEVIAAKKRTVGAMTKELLPTLLVDMMRVIPFKKRMRWDSSGDSFARPVRSLLCLYDTEYLNLRFADALSGETSQGHRFINPAPFKVTSIAQYKAELKARHVILKSAEREAIFVDAAREKLKKLKATLRIDADLMAMVRNLVEYPFVVLGSFEQKYLDIPSEILISEMKTHQKCFAVYDDNGALLPNFICSAATLPYDEEIFAKGNARVLRARFEDGAFYFAEDQKKTLFEHADALNTVIFERDLGTIAEKTARIAIIAKALAELFKMPAQERGVIEQAAPLLKADLTTGVVGEFPELQGIMGRTYALREHIDKDVAECIETHYWPRFAEDNLPRLNAAALLSIADKLDTLVGVIAIGKRPAGNKDPYALRRAAIAIVRLLVSFSLRIDVEQLVLIALKSYGDRFSTKTNEIVNDAKDFILQRARGLLIEDLEKETKDYAVNFADSVMAVGNADLLDIFSRAHTLFAMRNQSKQDFDSLAQAFKRASNIVKKAVASGETINESINDDLLQGQVERDLLKAVIDTRGLMTRPEDADFASLCHAYVEVFSQIAKIKPKLDAFFDGVMVMVDDPSIRQARLALLSEIKRAADRIADFTHL